MDKSPKLIQNWHHLIGNIDVAGLDHLLADEAVFHSPVVHAPQEGKALTKMYLTAAFHVLGPANFRYVREIVGERDAALEFIASIEEIEINGVDFIRWNDDDKIVDFKVMIRPMKAITTVRKLMREQLVKMARAAK